MFSLSGSTFLVDLNGDGDFSPRWRMTEQGAIVPREEIDAAFPFITGGEKLKAVELDDPRRDEDGTLASALSIAELHVGQWISR